MKIGKQKRNNANRIGNNHNHHNNISYNNDEYGVWRKWISRKSRASKKHDIRSEPKGTRRFSKCSSIHK